MVRPPSRRFDANYREEIVLADGTPVVLRTLQPRDKVLLARGFGRMSEESRFLRFLTAKQELTESDLAYMTELDGDRHFAIAAGIEDPIGREEGIGIARFVRLADRTEVAEPAVAVLDEFHGRGVGRLLCLRLAEAALERGVTTFRCDVLASNEPMRGLLESLVPDVSVQVDGDTATIEFALAPPGVAEPMSERVSVLERLLALAARGALVLRHRVFRSAD